MALNLGELYTTIDARNSGFKRGVAGSRAEMAGLQRDVNGRLRDIRGKFISEGEAAGLGYGKGVRESALQGVDGLHRDVNGRLRDARGRFVTEGELAGGGFGLGFLKGLRNRGPNAGTLGRILLGGTAIAGIASAAAGAASAIGPLIGLVGVLAVAVGTLAAAVPAFAVAGAVSIAALTIGFSNMGDAIKGDEEALEKLAPAAREVVGVLKGLKGAWESATKSIQQRLFRGLADDISAVAGAWIPLLDRGLGKVADGFNSVATAAAKALLQTEVMQAFKDVTSATKAGLESFASGLDGWLRGIGILISAFSPLLAEAGANAGALGDKFAGFMDRMEASGQLADFITQMKDTFSQLGDIAQNVGSILFNVFAATAESGGGLLGAIESITGKFADFLNSAEGGDALTSFFDSLRDVGEAVAPIILELAAAFGEDLAPHIAEIAKEVGPSLRDLVRELGDAIGEIDVKTLADGFASVLDSVSPLIEPLGNFIGKVSEIDGLVPAIVIALGLWTVAQWALNAAMYANPIVWIIALIIALIAAIVLIVIHWDEVVAAIKDRWQLMVDVWTAGKELVSSIWAALFDFVKARLNDFFAGVQRFGELPSKIAAWLSDMKDRAIAKFQEFASGVNDKVNLVLGFIQGLGGIPGKVAGFIQSAKDAAIAKFVSLVDWAKGLPGRILSAIGDLGSLLKGVGGDIIDGLLDGIQDGFGAVQDKLGELTSMLPDWKGPAAVDRVLLRGPAELIMSGFAESLTAGIPGVRKALEGVTSEIGLDVSGSNTQRMEVTTSLSEEDRALLRELAEARNNLHISTDANTRVAEIKRDRMVVA